MTLNHRPDRIATGASLPDVETIRLALEQVEASIAQIAAAMPEGEEGSMDRWWDWCRELATRDPLLAKLYAGMTAGDLAL